VQAANVDNLDEGPPWFQKAIAQINARIDRIENELRRVRAMAAWSFNSQQHDGRFVAFAEVPFPNGQMPTEPPHNLTPLRNLDDITNLTAVESAHYWNHYYHGNLPALPHRLTMIRSAIGCTAEI